MKVTIKLIIVLTVICAVCSALLAAVFKNTEEPINNALKTRTGKAAALVMPAGSGLPQLCEAKGISYFIAKKGGQVTAVAIEGHSKNGYGGEVQLMVGLGMDGKLISFEVVKASETPGLGSKMSSDAFKNPIKGRPINGNWTVKKDGGEIDAITAATISSRAALECIRDAIAKFNTIRESL